MVELYAIDISHTVTVEQLKKYLSLVSAEKRQRLSEFHFEEDMKRSLYGELLVRPLACQKLNIKNCQISFETNIYGKPSIKSFPHFYFNISHAGKQVVCAIDNAPVGVDFEEIKPIGLDIAKRFFTENEYTLITEEPEEQQTLKFYQIWTAKESYIKFIGTGLSTPLNSFSVYKTQFNEYRITENNKVRIKMIFDIEGYVLSVCYVEKHFP